MEFRQEITSVISIHALREESDVVFVDFVGCVVDFNPRSP